jgi:SAM-dependent methyltransferase
MKVAQAWSTFWATQGPGSRCLACAPPQLVEPLDEHWHSFASTLQPGTTVLDLGCGAGAVGRELLSARPELQVTGIDIAIIPPSDDERNTLLPCTPMELLPFHNSTFAAAVSQFGFEYARTIDAANEAARVLAAQAPLSLLIHHSQSPVVDGMRRHRRAIEGLCANELKTAFLAADRNAMDREFALLKDECGDPIIDQAACGFHAHILQDCARRTAVWGAVEEALEPERLMLAELDHFSVGEADIARRIRPLTETFELEPPIVVRTSSGEPMAWAIEGRRFS